MLFRSVHRLKQRFPQLTIVLNGGVAATGQIEAGLEHVDGVMLGREAYQNPWTMADWDTRFFGEPARSADEGFDRDRVEAAMVVYMQAMAGRGEPWHRAARHMLGLRNGLPGARHWRQVWSDHRLKHLDPVEVSRLAAAQPVAVPAFAA